MEYDYVTWKSRIRKFCWHIKLIKLLLNFQLSILVLFLCVTIWPFFMTRDAVCFILFLFCFVRPDKTFFRQDFAVTKIIKWKKHLPVKTSKFTTQVIHRIWLRVLWLMCNTSELTGDEKKQKHSEYLDPTSTQFFFSETPLHFASS